MNNRNLDLFVVRYNVVEPLVNIYCVTRAASLAEYVAAERNAAEAVVEIDAVNVHSGVGIDVVDEVFLKDVAALVDIAPRIHRSHIHSVAADIVDVVSAHCDFAAVEEKRAVVVGGYRIIFGCRPATRKPNCRRIRLVYARRIFEIAVLHLVF